MIELNEFFDCTKPQNRNQFSGNNDQTTSHGVGPIHTKHALKALRNCYVGGLNIVTYVNASHIHRRLEA